MDGQKAAMSASTIASTAVGADQVQVPVKELVALQPDVILAEGTSTAAALQAREPRDPDSVRRRLRSDRLRVHRELGAARR